MSRRFGNSWRNNDAKDVREEAMDEPPATSLSICVRIALSTSVADGR